MTNPRHSQPGDGWAMALAAAAVILAAFGIVTVVRLLVGLFL